MPAKKKSAPKKPKVETNDEVRIGKITQATIGWEDHGFLTAVVSFDYGGASQSIPARIFGTRAQGYSDALAKFVVAVMDAVGVRAWEQVVGKTCFVVIRDSFIKGLRPLPTEQGAAVDFDELFPSAPSSGDADG